MPDTAPFQLTSAQWRVVSIALHDAGSTKCNADPQSARRLLRRIRRMIERLAGIETCRPLADQRLEALRRFVLSVRREKKFDAELVGPLLEQGFSSEQILGIEQLAR